MSDTNLISYLYKPRQEWTEEECKSHDEMIAQVHKVRNHHMQAMHKIEEQERLKASDLQIESVTVQDRHLFQAFRVIDLLLRPDEAEGAAGDLISQYASRAANDPHHAKRWLWVQVGRIMFSRALDVIRQVAVATRAGK